ncbi:MAG: ankyrin repeat domain-containing protein [Alphaproteobacteria bacterium]|nr:ankyrin repeat domain-containing protein [Alphaproteobacteria bacterium]
MTEAEKSWHDGLILLMELDNPASGRPDTEKCLKLIKGGADINQGLRSKRGRTALMIAVKHDCAGRIISALIENGADVNARDQDGWTALMYAVVPANKDAIQTLIENGAHIGKENKFKKTAENLARQLARTSEKHSDIANFITTTAFQAAAEKGTIKPRKILHIPKQEHKG